MCEPISATAMTYMAVASATMAVATTGIQMKAQSDQQAAAQAGFDIETEQLATQRIILDQDIAAEKDSERSRQRLIAEEGARDRGQMRVGQAAMGQLVDSGSAADNTADLAGEVAFKRKLSQRDSAMSLRNLEIRKSSNSLQGQALGIRRVSSKNAFRTKQTSTALTGATKAAGNFKLNKKADGGYSVVPRARK